MPGADVESICVAEHHRRGPAAAPRGGVGRV